MRSWGVRLWRGFAWFYIVAAIASVSFYARSSLLQPEAYGGAASASLGADLIRTADTGRIDVIARKVRPAGPLAKAGVREGDRLRMDIPWEDFRTLATGEVMGFTRVAPGPAQHMSLPVPAFTGHAKTVANIRYLITLFDLAVGLLLYFRRRGDLAAQALGLAFVVTTISSNFPSSPEWAIIWVAVSYSGVALAPFLLLAFAMGFYNRHTAPMGALTKGIYAGMATALAGSFAVAMASDLTGQTGALVRLNTNLIFAEEIFAYGAAVWVLARGFGRSAGETRARYAFLILALGLTFALTAVQTYSFLVLKLARMDPDNPLYDVNVVLSFLGPLVFAYAVLRHRVVDMGFVINRTLVFGVVSLILLSAFGLIEWAVEHVLKPTGRNESAALDAAVALGVFLAFHRVRDAVEHRIEAVFFRRWHDAEKRLRQFTDDAPFITHAETLLGVFADEIAQFGGGAPAAIFRGSAKDGFVRVAGDGFGQTAAVDDPIVVAMRSRRTVVDDSSGRALGLPMLHRGELLGFVLVGPKPGGAGLGVDETDALARATHQVGLDLHALEVDRLERERADLKLQVAGLQRENDVIRGLVRAPAGERSGKFANR